MVVHHINKMAHSNTNAKSSRNNKKTIDRLIRVATSYNAAACKHIGDGEYDRSTKLIITAIRLFKTAAATQEHIREEIEKEKKGDEALENVDTFMTSFPTSVGVVDGREGRQHNDKDGYQQETTKNGDRWGNDENVTAYGRPIQLPSIDDTSGGGHPASSYLTILPPVLFFNLALAYHLQGIQTRRNDFLTKAVTLYESSFRCERNRCKNHNLFSSPLLLAAILNNIGHIQQCRQLQDAISSSISKSSSSPISPDVYFQRLFTMLTYLVQVRRICQSQYSGFFENCVTGMSSRNSISCAGVA
jgi:hypothetical protein